MPKINSVLEAARTLSERDLSILVAILEHKVLSSAHVRVLHFNSQRRAQSALQRLRTLGVLASFVSTNRSRVRDGDRYYLTDLGAGVCAWHLERPSRDLPSVPRSQAEARARSRHGHGVTRYLCDLVAACETGEGYGVHSFALERPIRCAGRQVQPDATARVLTPAGAVEFFFEYDRATENFGAITNKLIGYLSLAGAWEREHQTAMPAVVFLTDYPSREAMVGRGLEKAWRDCKTLNASSARAGFYATTKDLLRTQGHLGAVWIDLSAPGKRMSFEELPAIDGSVYDLRECIGRRWRTSPGEDGDA